MIEKILFMKSSINGSIVQARENDPEKTQQCLWQSPFPIAVLLKNMQKNAKIVKV